MGLTHFPNGVSSFGMPVLPSIGQLNTTGNVYFVDSGASNASDANAGTDKNKPLASLAGAFDKVTASQGDVIFLMPGHSETLTSSVALDVAGVAVIGLGWGGNKPSFSLGVGDAITVTADDIVLHNINFTQTITASFNIAADDLILSQCKFTRGNVAVSVTIASGDRLTVDHCRWVGTANGPTIDLAFEANGDSVQMIITDCVFDHAVAGIDTAAIQMKSLCKGLIQRCQFIGMDTQAVDIDSSTNAQGDGLIADSNIAGGAGIANIDTAVDAGGWCLCEVHGTDLPAEGGGLVPVTTPA